MRNGGGAVEGVGWGDGERERERERMWGGEEEINLNQM